MNKAYLQQFLFTLTVLLPIAGIVGAYSNPTLPPSGDSQEEVPIDIGATNQVKKGDLSVWTFNARDNALITNQSFFGGMIRGGLPTDTNSTVTIGSLAHKVSTLANGLFAIKKTISASTLASSALTKVCADANGDLKLCGACIPSAPVDLCTNIPGIQTTLNSDLTIDNPAQPTICTAKIRGIIDVGDIGTYGRNTSNNSYQGFVNIRSIKVVSVGGVPTTVWPSATPLEFKWGICAKWNTAYSGPFPRYDIVSSTPILAPIVGDVSQGTCDEFPAAYPNPLPYGRSTQGAYGYLYHNGWDSTHGVFRWGTYIANNLYLGPEADYKTFNTQQNEGSAHIKYPLEKVILYDVVVPSPYTLELTAPAGISTSVEIRAKTFTNTVTVSSTAGPRFTSLSLWKGAIANGFAIPLSLGQSKDLDPGTYFVDVRCGAGPRGTATPMSFTIPQTGGVTINNITCP